MDLAPSVGVFTRPVTTSINRFSAVNATKTRILNKARTEMLEEQFVFLLCDSWRVEKGVVVIYFSPIHLSLSPLFVTHPQSDSSRQLSSDFSGSLRVNTV